MSELICIIPLQYTFDVSFKRSPRLPRSIPLQSESDFVQRFGRAPIRRRLEVTGPVLQQRQCGEQEQEGIQLQCIDRAHTWRNSQMRKCHPTAVGRKEREPVRRVLGPRIGRRSVEQSWTASFGQDHLKSRAV
mgnify:CR=1 FL=1